MTNTFFTWEYLLTFAGCVLATGVLTEWLKSLLPNIHEQVISYVIAFVIMIAAQLATGGMKSWDVAALDVLNAVVVSLSANGAYDAIINVTRGGKTGNNQ